MLVQLGIFNIVSVFRDPEILVRDRPVFFPQQGAALFSMPLTGLYFGKGWLGGWKQRSFLQAVTGSNFLFPWGHCPWRGMGTFPDPEMRAFLEENTRVTSSGSLTPEIRLRLLTPTCKFWWERADLWPHSDPYWAVYWPGGQALSRYCVASWKHFSPFRISNSHFPVP